MEQVWAVVGREGGRDLSALVCVRGLLSGEKETPGICQRLKQHKGTQEDLGEHCFSNVRLSFIVRNTRHVLYNSWLVAPISSSNILAPPPPQACYQFAHCLPALWLCWLGVAAGPMALLKSPLGHQQPIRDSDQLGLTCVSTWVDIILKAKKRDSFPQLVESFNWLFESLQVLAGGPRYCLGEISVESQYVAETLSQAQLVDGASQEL